MKSVKLIFSLLLIGLNCQVANCRFGSEVPEGLIVAFKSGNAKEITNYCNNNIELEILGNENICTKLQAQQIIKSFFEQHPVKNFSILFEGGKESSKYAIGKLVTSKGTYRVNLLFKLKSIVQLRIEEDNGN
jgi:hypothetical protein